MSLNKEFIDHVADLLGPLGSLSDGKFFRPCVQVQRHPTRHDHGQQAVLSICIEV